MCYNGQEAVEIFESGFVSDLILIELQLPKTNGIEATSIIGKTLKNTPIIAQTAYATLKNKELALQAGCNDYFSKPLDPSQLLNRINQYFTTST